MKLYCNPEDKDSVDHSSREWLKSALTVRQVHARAEREYHVIVSLRTVWDWAGDGKLGASVGYRRQGRLYSVAAVDAFLRRRFRV